MRRPKLPRYQDKAKGRFLLTYAIQAISRRVLARGMLIPAGLNRAVRTVHTAIKPARMVPRIGFYGVEIVYEQAASELPLLAVLRCMPLSIWVEARWPRSPQTPWALPHAVVTGAS